MFPMSRLLVKFPHAQIRHFGAAVAEAIKFEVNVDNHLDTHSSDMMQSQRPTTIEGVQGQSKPLNYEDSVKALQTAIDYSVHGPSIQGIQGGHDDMIDAIEHGTPETSAEKMDEHSDAFNCHSNLNLHGCMQSNVPEPFSSNYTHYESPCNIPGSGRLQMQKYISDVTNGSHPNRQYHTSAVRYSRPQMLQHDDSPSPQGIQGDDCTLDLWMETCMRYDLPNCQEQLANIKEGRKTLSEVFAEQELILKEIANNYKQSAKNTYEFNEFSEMEYPCPQGIQGDDCARYQLWLENCQRFSFGNCKEQLSGVRSGRTTLSEVLADQDAQIRNAVTNFYQKRKYSTQSDPRRSEVGKDEKSQTEPGKLSNKNRLKRAVKEYGSTVIVFHVGISLVSLGGFYLAVSSGIDMVSLLTKLGFSETIVHSKMTAGASTFVLAYGVHKLFAPVRIAITLTSVPLIVRYLRRIGFLKPPKNL